MIYLNYTRDGGLVRVFSPYDPTKGTGVEIVGGEDVAFSPYTLSRIAAQALGLTREEVVAQGVRLLHPDGSVSCEHPPTKIEPA